LCGSSIPTDTHSKLLLIRTIMSECGCKGVRVCRLCEDRRISMISPSVSFKIERHAEETFAEFKYCGKCGHVFIDSPTLSPCKDHINGPTFPGVTVLLEFISEAEEEALIHEIDSSPWVPSQSGRYKQDYGVKVNFKKKRVVLSAFTGLPNYSRKLVRRLHQRMRETDPSFTEFYPVELCNLEYLPQRGAAIVPHVDDSWLWGERIVLLNLASETNMLFTLPMKSGLPADSLAADEWNRYKAFSNEFLSEEVAQLLPRVTVHLPRRCLFVMSGPPRHVWLHEINRKDIKARRISLTLRELSDEYLPHSEHLKPYAADNDASGGDFAQPDPDSLTPQQCVGLSLIRLASTYNGVCVGMQTGQTYFTKLKI
uniref:Alpha-ketoglutarate-dependent dioxygenase alkB homolog 4 n=1 Tax=Schistocephalus solidus TaxID=70667 RepID=A0A183THZ4_SCHSO